MQPYVFANSNPQVFTDPTGEFTIMGISVGMNVQTAMKGAKLFVTQKLKQAALDTIQNIAARALINLLQTLIPFDAGAVGSLVKDLGRWDAGNFFQETVEKIMCRVVDVPGWIWFEPSVNQEGKATDDGFSCSDRKTVGDRTSKIERHISRPDIIFKEKPPTSTAGTAWLIGDVALSGNTFYKKYVQPGTQKEQFTAMVKYAERNSRIAVFFSAWEVSKKHLKEIESMALKQALSKGVLAFFISIQ